MPADPAHPQPATARASPLWAVLAFAWLNSLASGTTFNGIFFTAKHAYHFSAWENYGLALLLGVTYIGGALGIGPLVARLTGRGALSTRTVLAFIILLLGALCFLPFLSPPVNGATAIAAGTGGGAGLDGGNSGEGGARAGSIAAAWPIWLLVGLYSPVSGALWPIVESYISSGRSSKALGSAIGTFNIVWSSALVVSLCAMGLGHDHTLFIFAVQGLVHLVSLAALTAFTRNPAHAHAQAHPPSPPVYHRLLAMVRVLLPTSYMAMNALQPLFPSLLGDLGVAKGWQTPLASTWLAARVVTFLALQRWHGWHGTWSMPLGGMALFLAGFGLCILAPAIAGPPLGVVLFLAGLTAFGVGAATVYFAALYYAMEVGSAQVDAGGMHEALIGVGYTAGPLCGLATLAAVDLGVIDQDRFEVAMIGTVVVLSAGAGVLAVRRVAVARTPTGPDAG